MCAAKRGHHRAILFLLQHGSPIDLRDSHQRTCLHVAAHSADVETVDIILKVFLNLINNFAVLVFGYLILISIYFYRFYFSIFSVVFVSIEEIYQTLKAVFEHVSKRLEVLQNYSCARRIFNSPPGVWISR